LHVIVRRESSATHTVLQPNATCLYEKILFREEYFRSKKYRNNNKVKENIKEVQIVYQIKSCKNIFNKKNYNKYKCL
jgi:hypothetical protein